MENEQDTIILKQTADCIDSRTQQQIIERWNEDDEPSEERDFLLESSISGEYHLEKRHKTIQTAKVHIYSSFYGEDEVMEIIIDRI